MGLTRIKVVLRKETGASEGYLKIRTTANRKSTYKTLGIPMHDKHWNSKTEEVRKTHPQSEDLNKFIQEEVRKHKLFGPIPTYTINADRSLLNYLLRYIENTTNPGTKNVRRATYKKLVDYFNHNGIKDLNFEDLTSDHVHRFYNYLRGDVSINTSAHHIKTLRIAVNTAVKDGVTIPYINNPFKSLRLKRVEPKIIALDSLQVHSLQEESRLRPNKYLNMFLFSLFGQGMRKSDLLMLKWKNFSFEYEKLKLTYLVRKSRKEKSFNLSPMAVFFLRTLLYEKFPTLKADIQSLEEIISEHRVSLDNCIEQLRDIQPEEESERTRILISIMMEGKNEHQARIGIQKKIKKLQEDISYHETSIEEYQYDIYELCGKASQELASKMPEEFVFHPLRGMKLTKYLNVEEEYMMVDKKAKLYNYHLRTLGEKLGIKNLTPHRARHTYLQLIHNSGANLQTIQFMAGHSDPKQTQDYLRRMNPTSTEDADRKLSDDFSNF